MARSVKPDEYAAKRNEILDAALRMMMIKGYERLAIRDILDEIQISSGAFHHYFESRGALLQAMIERMLQEAGKSLLPLIHDPHLPAIEKLQGFFDTLDSMRIARKSSVVAMLRVWYADDNALVRQKVNEAVFEQRTPLLVEIVRQGIRENNFTTAYPDQAGEVILSLVQGMGSTHAQLLLELMQERDGGTGNAGAGWIDDIVERIVATHAAYMDAIEKVLGAPPFSLRRSDAKAVKVWVNAVREVVEDPAAEKTLS